MRPKILITILFIILIIIAGYIIYSYRLGEEELIPEIELGVDRCDVCGMIISEGIYAAAYYDAGEGEWVRFDDIGCMLKWIIERGDIDTSKLYVHDFKSGEWIPAEDAVYIRCSAKDLWTPMSSGIVAFARYDDAKILANTKGCEIYMLNELIEWAINNPDKIYQMEM